MAEHSGKEQDVPRWLIALLIGLHLCLGVLYSVMVPAWEAHDEWAHYKYAEYLAKYRTLPAGGDPLTDLFGYDQSTQPPLYYILAALPIALVNPTDEVVPTPNPYAGTGTGQTGVNMVVHDGEAERFPYRGTFLALHLARLVSVLISTAGVWTAYKLARALFPGEPAVVGLSTAIAAFLPEYLFIGAVVTNDILIAVLGALVIYYACLLVVGEITLPRLLGLGVSLALALLTKYTALGLVPLVILALLIALWRALRRHALRHSLLVLGVPLLSVPAVAGWWYLRNLQLYGYLVSRDADVLTQFWQVVLGPESLPRVTLPQAASALWYGFQTFWVSFGWGNVGLPAQSYIPLAALVVMALISVLVYLVRRHTPNSLRAAVLLLGFGCVSLGILLFYRELFKGEPILRGRMMLPTLPAISALLALGLGWWWPARLQHIAAGALAAGLLAFALALPFAVIAPAYTAPTQDTAPALPPDAYPLAVRFGELAELYAYEIGPATVPKGHAVGVTLYWKTLGTSSTNYTLGVYALGAENQPYGQVLLYPGRGNYATSLWKPGQYFRDAIWVPIVSERPAPCLGQIAVTLFRDDASLEHLPVTDSSGTFLGYSAIFGRFKIAPAESTAEPFQPAEARFGDEIVLLDVEMPAAAVPGARMELLLRFQALRRPAADYILFVHLLDAQGQWVTGVDGPPLLGNYPTGLWDAGEIIVEPRAIILPSRPPAGRYRIGVGWYRQDTLQRLSALDSQGNPLPNDIWLSEVLQVEAAGQEVLLPLVQHEMTR
ncbi:MAG: ArnT family glycosyltransferase [Anaerolineae bacterium]